MRAVRRIALLSLLISAVVGGGVACGAFSGSTDSEGDGGDLKDDATIPRDGSTQEDAAGVTDALVMPGTDAGKQPTTFCIPLDAEVNNCGGCDGSPLRCTGPGTDLCVGACLACAQKPAECFLCDSVGKNPVGTCQPYDDATYCLNGNYGAGSACACPSGESDACPGDNQECLMNEAGVLGCHSCGESLTLGKGTPKCKNGKACNPGPTPDSLTCH